MEDASAGPPPVDDGEVPAAPADSSPLDDAPASSGAEPGDGGYDEGEPLDNEQAGPADVEGLDDAGEPGAAPEDGEEGTGGEGEAGAGAEAPGDGESPEAAAEAEAAAAAPPPPVELEPLPEDYVPVRDLPPIPEPFARNEEGKPVPLDGVESLFLTGTTIELVGLKELGAANVMGEVSRDELLKDIQFRGAISDFHAYKAKIQAADYEPLLVRFNEDDVYGDGNNFELAVTAAAAAVWRGIGEEVARRAALLELEAAHAAAEKAKPRSKRVRKVKPWQSMGSEVDIEEASVRPRRDPIRLVVQRRRREFNQPNAKLADKDAHELWNSSQMECRPFKDPNFDMRRMEQDVAVQAVAPLRDAATQSTGTVPPRPAVTQTEPLDLPPEAKQDLVRRPRNAPGSVADFLERVRDQCEVALVQNEITNIFRDDLSSLNDEADGGGGGSRKETLVSEAQSFTHLTYSKNKVVSAIQWLPHRKGVVAVACTEAQSHAERVARMGRTAPAHILLWNFRDPIHPELVLQSPWEVFSFQFNPLQPDLLTGGCYNGQVVLWDLSSEADRLSRRAGGGAGAGAAKSSDGAAAGAGGKGADSTPPSTALPGGGGGGGGVDSTSGSSADGDAHIPVIKHRFMTDTQFSHHQVVTDLQWLPGVEISHRGKVTKLGEGSKECNFFATIAADGKVLFWDVRVEKLLKKGKKADELLDLVWKPIHSVHLISLIGMDLGGTKLAFDFRKLEQGMFYAGSFDGELVYADFVKPEGEENPDYAKSCLQAHVGPVIALERSPFFDDIVLTCGDWQWQIWQEGQSTPLFQSGYAQDYYTAACWSPTRPAVLYLADQSGSLEVWDLLDRSHEPSIRVTLAATPIMSLSFNPMPTSASAAQQAAQQLLAVGDATGVLRIMELPRNLRRPVHNEKKLMGTWLERQQARLADVGARQPVRTSARKEAEERKKEAESAALAEAAAKEAAAKDAAAAAAAGMPLPTANERKKDKGPPPPEFDEKAEQEYLKLEARFKAQLGLMPAEANGGPGH
ncbi:hypothetical protein CHLRE_16g674515v5 [Chlamydomonas reinhardtii]|uniref:Uncharacterized protein n=1 Tax=Chlamydomonas reinhardtii TaxID=3055 RepID=A8J3B6_CHLRE|nr:uncharacterized protein CHLRE_16g674515v5 [Chlamydomonas reinhardtii]PNW72384.1 hypothetical protein CHLRE_16g674515v5 [Chlamydomonas reinhardtii]8GLV_AG Chain AG, IC140 [Chlamydomonas reinhardtii]|eukprot:XP_001695786.1 flagellar inner dynein arm I1 intermediate chain IC140 [Chlamydomonas reinhardtii]